MFDSTTIWPVGSTISYMMLFVKSCDWDDGRQWKSAVQCMEKNTVGDLGDVGIREDTTGIYLGKL